MPINSFDEARYYHTWHRWELGGVISESVRRIDELCVQYSSRINFYRLRYSIEKKIIKFWPQRKYVKSESDILYTDIANSSYLATATRLLEEFFKCFPRIKKSNPNAWASFHNNISHLKVSSLSPFSYWNGVSSLINCWTFVCSLHSTINVKDKVSIRLKLPLRRTAVTDGCPKVWIIRNWSFGCCCWLYACNGCGPIDDFRVFFTDAWNLSHFSRVSRKPESFLLLFAISQALNVLHPSY